MVIIGIYSAWRPQELSILKTSDIDIENNTMFGGLKTEAGKNRYVPIHPVKMPLIKQRYNMDNEYLFNDENGQNGTHMTYDKYRGRFDKIMLKLIVGHAIEDIIEKIYTHRTMEQLQEEITKIK